MFFFTAYRLKAYFRENNIMIHQISCSWMLVTNIKRKLLSGLFLMLLFVPTVAASNPPQPKKSVNSSKAEKSRKPRKPASGYSRAGGSRGCPGEVIPLTVLAPNTFVVTTTSVRPTFTWFASQPQPTEFRLFELDASRPKPKTKPKRIGDPIKLQSISGINQLSLPKSQPTLTVGKEYMWQVSIGCSYGPFIQRAEFMVVPKSSVLDGQLSRVTNNSQKAYIYAEEDLWYEALSEALKVASSPGKLGKEGSDIVRKLAESDSLIPEKLAPGREKEIQQRRNYLEQIAGKG